jgi:CheY-like chemotaxis protein
MQHILLVEDNENDVFFARRAFKSAGVENPLHVAETGQEAIDYLSGTGKYADRSAYPIPALVLLDLKLPHVPGLDVLKWIQEQPALKRLIVIALTSSHLDVDIERAYELGANAFLVKPSNVELLTGMARAIDGFWLKLNRPPTIR